MQDPTVEKLFKEQIKDYSKGQTARSSPLISFFSEWLTMTHRSKKTLAIGEFGGAAGQLLAALNRLSPNSNLTNIDIIKDYAQVQILKKIKFITGSILDSSLPSQSFDVLVIRDVLHHLIGKDMKSTFDNQRRAIKKLNRLIRPDGIILIEELTNQSAATCRLIYFLSRLNSKIGLRLPKWEISPNTIICPLTPQELTNLVQKELKIKQQTVIYKKSRHWQSRLIHLFSAYGKSILVAGK